MGVLNCLDSGSQLVTGDGPTVKGSDWDSGCEQLKGQSGTVDVNSERVRVGQWM